MKRREESTSDLSSTSTPNYGVYGGSQLGDMRFCGDPSQPRPIGTGHLTRSKSGDLCHVVCLSGLHPADPAIINPTLRIGLCRREVAATVSHCYQPYRIVSQCSRSRRRTKKRNKRYLDIPLYIPAVAVADPANPGQTAEPSSQNVEYPPQITRG